MIDWKTTYPEEKGIPSIFLLKMMERWERDLCHVHGYLILRGGQPAAEAYHFPYSEKDTRYVHSVSKRLPAPEAAPPADDGDRAIDRQHRFHLFAGTAPMGCIF